MRGLTSTLLVLLCIGCPAPPAEESPPAPVPKPAEPLAQEAVAATVEGTVERQSGETWVAVQVGDRFREDDAVRTGAHSRVDLEVGENARLTVASRSDVAIRELTDVAHRFNLRQGRVSVDYEKKGERVLKIETETGDTYLQASSARFNVLKTDTTFSVATETGSVNLHAAGVSVPVAAGEQSVVHGDAPPSERSALTASLLLKVARSARSARTGRDLCATVVGNTDVGAEVTVDGARVTVGPDGRFSQDVPRSAGKTSVRVVTRDASGRGRERTVACSAPPKAEPAAVKDLSIQWGDAPDQGKQP